MSATDLAGAAPCRTCSGAGAVTVPEHDARCDGTCRVGCPVPTEEPCADCLGTGSSDPLTVALADRAGLARAIGGAALIIGGLYGATVFTFVL